MSKGVSVRLLSQAFTGACTRFEKATVGSPLNAQTCKDQGQSVYILLSLRVILRVSYKRNQAWRNMLDFEHMPAEIYRKESVSKTID